MMGLEMPAEAQDIDIEAFGIDDQELAAFEAYLLHQAPPGPQRHMLLALGSNGAIAHLCASENLNSVALSELSTPKPAPKRRSESSRTGTCRPNLRSSRERKYSKWLDMP